MKDCCEFDARFGCCYFFPSYVKSARASCFHFPHSATNNNKIENQTSTIQAPSARLAASALSLAHRSTCPNLCGGWKDAAEGVEYSSFRLRKAHCCYPLALIAPLTGWEIPRRSWTRMGGIQFSGMEEGMRDVEGKKGN